MEERFGFNIYIVEKYGMEAVLKAHEKRRNDKGENDVKHSRETFNILDINSRKSAAVIENEYIRVSGNLDNEEVAEWIKTKIE